MRWLRIAWRDLGAARRSRKLYGTLLFFGLSGGLFGYVSRVSPDAGPEALVLDLFLGYLYLSVLVGMGIAFDSIVGLRNTGGLHFLLSLPYSRRDVAVGTFLGRVVTMCASIATGLLAFAAITYYQGVGIPIGPLVGTFLLLSAAAIAAVSIALAISMSVRSRTTAGVVVLIAFVGFSYAWWYVPDLLAVVLPDLTARYEDGLLLANPITSVIVVSKEVFGTALLSTDFLSAQLPMTAVGPSALVLLGYATLPLAAAYARFRRRDL